MWRILTLRQVLVGIMAWMGLLVIHEVACLWGGVGAPREHWILIATQIGVVVYAAVLYRRCGTS